MELLIVRIRNLLGHIKAEELMAGNVCSLSASMSIETAVEEFFLNGHVHKVLPVREHGETIGLLNLSEVKGLSRAQWKEKKVEDIMQEISAENSVSLKDSALVILTKMIKQKTDLLPIRSGTKVEGFVTTTDLLRYLDSKAAFHDSCRQCD